MIQYSTAVAPIDTGMVQYSTAVAPIGTGMTHAAGVYWVFREPTTARPDRLPLRASRPHLRPPLHIRA